MNFLRTATSSGLLALALTVPGWATAAERADAPVQLAQKQGDPNAQDNNDDGKKKDRRDGGGGGDRGDRGGGDRGDRGDRGGGGNRERAGGGGGNGGGDNGANRERGGGGERNGAGGGGRERGDDGRAAAEKAKRDDDARRAAGENAKRDEEARRAAADKAKRDDDARRAAGDKAKRDDDARRAAADSAKRDDDARRAAADKARRDAEQRQERPSVKTPPRAENTNKIQQKLQEWQQRRGGQQLERQDDRRDGRRDDRRDDRRDGRRDDDRRGPPPVQVQRPDDRRNDRNPNIVVQPRKLESFRDRFRSRVGDDKAIQDLRSGRDERVRERRERVDRGSPFRGFEDLKSKRRERREGNRVVIEEPDKRSIIRDGNRTIIRTDERERWNRNFRDVRRERRNGRDVSIAVGFGGAQIYEDFDDDGRTRRRWRVGSDGREIVLFDNSRSARWRDRRGRPDGGLFEAIIDLPPPRLRIPRDEYIVDYERASDDDLYDALSAPPVEEIDDRYSLDEIRSSYSVRDRMRRVDLDTINFEFGSWEVNENDYDRLERMARAMRRVLRNNPDEMFLIEGHTDAVGSDEDNLTLSDRRAESVARILSEEFRVPQENMTTQGYGEQFLKINTSGPERENRRVAIRNISPLLAR